MLVDSFSFTHDETAPSVDSQAQLLVEAGWRRPRLPIPSSTPCQDPEGCDEAHRDEEF
ncbi:hypothetical protein [Streptacidiphilus jiangxiensis]|uniref:Uncharacterized protein n=1 Tax=Streptacidiphilus jiangxiensis TaxID=235985 RepID=A0A1H7XCY4_STRJI|nr:hypothetical protein [Streptacidiphilus jiangxiensis]SEM31037.1 hypothetical protein SAMN05414137_12384 [Streptacidiphilus jiangxiensis]